MKNSTAKKIVPLLILVLLFSLTGCFGKKAKSPGNPSQNQPPADEPAPAYSLKSPLTGLPVAQNKGIMAVMVENFKTARPQSGLDKADIIYEMLAEGGITRFIVLFSSQEAQEIGPVRSARPYFVEAAREWKAIFVHYGGTQDGYKAIKSYNVKDIDGIIYSNLFWRDKTRKAPHNAYSTTESFRKFKDNPEPPSARWEFAEYKGEPQFKEITVSYNKDTTVKYTFDQAVRKYLRFVNDKPHLDRPTGKQLSVTNVVVQYADHSVYDNKGHYDINLRGEGKAEFFLGGRYIAGSWKKPSLGSPTSYFDDKGQPVQFVPGNTWIQIFPDFRDISKK